MRVQRFVQVVLVGGLSFAATTSFQRALRAAPTNPAPTRAVGGRPAVRTEPGIEGSVAARPPAACRAVRVVYPGLAPAEGCRPS